MTTSSRLYLGVVISAGCGLAIYFLPRELDHPMLAGSLLLTTLLVSVFKVRLPLGNSGVSTMSMGYAIDFVALIIEGANLAMLLGAIGVLIQCTVRAHRRQPIHRAAFSAAAVIIAVQVAGMGWHALDGSFSRLTLSTTVFPLMVCAITYFIVNTSLVVGAVATTSSLKRAMKREFLYTAPAFLVAAMIAGLVALAIMHGVFLLLPIVASPLYVCYRSYQKRWMAIARELVAVPTPQSSAAA